MSEGLGGVNQPSPELSVVDIIGGEARPHRPDERLEGRVGLCQVTEHDVDARGGNAAIDLDDKVAIVVRRVRQKQVVGAELLTAKFMAQAQGVLRRLCLKRPCRRESPELLYGQNQGV